RLGAGPRLARQHLAPQAPAIRPLLHHALDPVAGPPHPVDDAVPRAGPPERILTPKRRRPVHEPCDYLHAFRKATKSASSRGVSCWSSPAGITDTLPGCMSSTSGRGMWASSLALIASTTSSGPSLRTTPLIVLPDFVVTTTGS